MGAGDGQLSEQFRRRAFAGFFDQVAIDLQDWIWADFLRRRNVGAGYDDAFRFRCESSLSVVCEVGDSTAMADGATELSLAGVAEGSWASASQTKRKTPAMIARRSLVLGGFLIPTHSLLSPDFFPSRSFSAPVRRAISGIEGRLGAYPIASADVAQPA